MNISYKLLLAFLFLSWTICSHSQGMIRGTVIEDTSGEPLFGVTIQIEGTTHGAITDFDGKFEIKAPPDTYNLRISFISFQTVTITGLLVAPNEVTIVDQIRLKEDVATLEEVVITAEVIKTTETALLTVKKKSANVLDGISSQMFRKTGANNAALAVARVPGVSIQEGKYIFVRGLGDRYTKVILNEMEIPGIDPDRNTLQLDIFPTNVINNIIVLKSFTADLPADFTGGIVNIETKDFPDEKTMKVTAGVGINPDMHFNNAYVSYEGSSTDFLGFDNGQRDLPFSSETIIPNANAAPDLAESQQIHMYTNAFNPIFGASTSRSTPNFNLSFSTGNQMNRGRVTLGYNAALSYRNQTLFYDSAENNSIWLKNSTDRHQTKLEQDRSRKGIEGSNNVLIGSLIGLAAKTKTSKIQFTGFHVQNGETVANIYDETNIIRNDNRSIRDILGYSERAITSTILSGNHFFDPSNIILEWKLSPTFSKIEDKDVRLAPFTRSEEGALNIEPSEGGNPIRLWRFLDETNYSTKINVSKKISINGRNSKIKWGFSGLYKERDFSIDNFDFLIINPSLVPLNGDPNNLLTQDNLFRGEDTNGNGSVNLRKGTAVIGTFQPSNSYSGSIRNLAFYVSSELALTNKIKAIAGVRWEDYVQKYTGGDQDFFNSDGATGTFFNNEKVLTSFKPFPTLNIIYNYKENANFRLSYTKTIARPSFKEKSIAQIVDPISATTYIGNVDLIETDIHNFDIRWEYFMQREQTISISGFYKTFINPIEIEVFSALTPTDFTARNNGDAQVFGMELEARKNMKFVDLDFLQRLFINLNASIIKSRLDISEEERIGREGQARIGETIDDTRQMQGQSPYLINAGLTYKTPKGWETGLYYNVQGSALAVVGTGITPDLYTTPFNSLNFNLQRSFGKNQNAKVRFRVSNLLDDKQETHYESFNAKDRIASSRTPSRTLSLSLSHRIH